jgi:hypothetical protein
MSRLCRFFAILIAAYTAAGCSAVGDIGGSEIDLFWAVPNRLAYNSGNTFIPASDLQVFVSYQGVAKSVSLSLVEIGIAENPYMPNDLKNVPLDKGYKLESAGKKIIIVKYSGLSTSYTIEVSASTGNGTGSGIIIEGPL